MVNVVQLVSLLQKCFGEEKVVDLSNGGTAKTQKVGTKPKDLYIQERCMCCGVTSSYFEMMYDNGYAVCPNCHRTCAEQNYYGRSIWI